jgi:hypothetical protein
MILWLMFIGSLVVLPTSALLALRWAIQTGQLNHFQKGALLIFDEEEPVGLITDRFPGAASPGQQPPPVPRARASHPRIP